MPSAPWTIAYADGSANRYRLSHDGTDVLVEYVPITPAESSTGLYSGGEPWTVHLAADDTRIAELWRELEALAANRALHIVERVKGSGAFVVTTPAGRREWLIAMSDPLRAFDAHLETLRLS